MLGALGALAEGETLLRGAEQLRHKECDRIAMLGKLLDELGRQHELRPDGIRIFGPVPNPRQEAWKFSPAGDHRMVMAAAVLRLAGHPIEIENMEALKKSAPEFLTWFKGRLRTESVKAHGPTDSLFERLLGSQSHQKQLLLIVGHRGTGKTRFLSLLKDQNLGNCLDLDEEISRHSGTFGV